MADKAKKEVRRFTTPPFVISYPHIFEAQKMDTPGAKAKFSCQAVWTPSKFTDKDKKLWNAIGAEVTKAINDKFKTKGANRVNAQKQLREKFDGAKMGIRNGAQRADSPGYGEGTLFATLSTTSPPGVVNLAGERISVSEGNSDEIYPGAICRATITVYAYDNKGKGYALGLGNLQKIKDGPRLDSRVAAEDDFDEEVNGAWLDQEDESAGEDAGSEFEGADD